MTVIVSENDQLIERLGLLVLNSPLLNAEGDEEVNDQPADFVATLAAERNFCEPASQVVVLVAKPTDPAMTEAIADVCRLLMAHSHDSKGKLVVIKKERGVNDDAELMNTHLLDVRQRWCQEWTFLFEKVRNLPNSEARSEALERLDNWTAPTLPDFSLLYFDDPELPKRIAETLELRNGMRIRDGLADRPLLFTKPPALHWSHFPRDSEMQIMFKFVSARSRKGTMPDPFFREITRSAKECFDFEYTYAWQGLQGGLFLREGLTKISIYRTNAHTIEVAGRIDVDEFAAEEDENAGEPPFKTVWPILSRVLNAVVRQNLEYRTDCRLPYMLNIAFFGQSFFKDLNYVDVNGPVSARLLDAVQTFAALERTGAVKFGIGKRLVGIDVKQAFPGFQPHSMADIFALADLPVNTSRSTSSSRLSPAPSSAHSHHPTTVIFENPDDEPDDSGLPSATSPANVPMSPPGTGIGERSNSHGGLLGLATAKNRGRRVSFGAIRAIPQNFHEARRDSHMDQPKSGFKKPGVLHYGQNDTSSRPNSAASPSPSQPSVKVDEFVDQLLQQTINDVLGNGGQLKYNRSSF
ncbi:hypothetical protein M3Y99_00023300 [Aphelenchoides fujianensis]|nr:hypothetical protein M3Y99_00023300 [Aphelenchoides fujianensis]